MTEIWAPIPGLSPYAASSEGRIGMPCADPVVVPQHEDHASGDFFSVMQEDKDGNHSKHYVRRLVCSAFHGIPQYVCGVRHIDGDVHHNRQSNLKWEKTRQNL